MEKKLQRDLQHRVIGGVCSGLGNYLGIDTAIVRVLFVLAFLAFSTGFWLYVLLWILMPSGAEGSKAEASAFVSETMPEKVKDNKGSLVVGLVLIGLGAFGLLHQYIPQFNWRTLWPVLLIILGVMLIVPRKSNSHEKP